MITGPITGGTKGGPFGRPLFDLGERGYVLEEFVLSGDATTYRQVPGSTWGRDGRWQVEPKGSVPFTTRFLVYRPADPASFNGTALVCWNNVTAGYELFAGESPEILDGYAFVGATVQRVGVHGFPATKQGLRSWDPDRYGSLDIPTDDASYDVFAQIGRAVGPSRNRAGIDPMGGLDVQRVIALGASQSAGRLATVVNAIHPIAPAFDGYLLQIYFGRGTPIEVGENIVQIDLLTQHDDPEPGALLRSTRLAGSNLLREIDVPVMVVNSELEAAACHDVRQPDTDRFRYWESAGTSHGSHRVALTRAAKYRRDFGVDFPVVERMNRIAITPLYDAAIHHLTRWVQHGTPPPSQPLVEFAGDPATIVRDEHGIARGGIRLPQVEAPVACNSAVALRPDMQHLLLGSNEPFDAATLTRLYGDEAGFRRAFRAAAEQAFAAGVMLPRDVEPELEDAVLEYRRGR